MGYNTTVVVMNDAVDSIKHDPEFGKHLAEAIMKNAGTNRHIDVSSGPNVNAATVIESHHADGLAIVAVGGNYGEVISNQWNCSNTNKEKILREMAREMGFVLHKKSQRR